MSKLIDSPFEVCSLCDEYVFLDQTYEECAREHKCAHIPCPLKRFFAQRKFSESPIDKEIDGDEKPRIDARCRVLEEATMKRVFLLLIPLLTFACTQAFAAGDLSRNKPEKVVIEMGSNADKMYFKPNHLEFETGKAYKIVLVNVDTVKHELDAGEFAEKIFTRKVEIKDESGKMLAEIKGSVREIEVGPKSEVEWYVVPVQTGNKLAMECALPGHKKAGMHGTITIN